MNKLKKILLRLLGSPRRKYMRFAYRRALQSESLENRFTWIFKNRFWSGRESASGTGSTLSYTENLRKSLPALFEKYRVSSVFDGPCGDFNWMKEVVRESDIHYIGGDIVARLIEENNRKYRSETISFIHVDITRDALPASDLMICRDCLFHLSYSDIGNFIRNFCRSDIKYLLTTNHINHANFDNTDIVSGAFRLIDLFKPPFGFPEPLESIDDWIEPHPPRQMCLWSREQLEAIVL